ncbi:hypothetical protein J6590_081872 [Homalodisca vitripennis]|nr:hypothetical protein J6590_081872 [Homalodisca vitripennis]
MPNTCVGSFISYCRDRAQIRHPRDSNPCITAYSVHKPNRNNVGSFISYCRDRAQIRHPRDSNPCITAYSVHKLDRNKSLTHTITPVWGSFISYCRDRAQIRHPRDSNPCITAYSVHKLDRNKSLVHTLYQCNLDTHHYTSVGSFISYCRDRAQIRHPRDSNPCITAYSVHKPNRNKSLVHTIYQCYLDTHHYTCVGSFISYCRDRAQIRHPRDSNPCITAYSVHKPNRNKSLVHTIYQCYLDTHHYTSVGSFISYCRDRAQIRHPRDSNPCITAYSVHKLDRNKSLVHTIYQCYLDTHHYTSVGSFISYCRDRAQIRHPRDSNPCITAYSVHKLDRNKSLAHTIYQCYLDTHHYTCVGSFISYCRDRAQIRHPRDSNPCITAYSVHKLDRNKSLAHTIYQCYLDTHHYTSVGSFISYCRDRAQIRHLEIPTHVLQLICFTNLIETSLLYILSTSVIWTHTITPVWGALSRTVGTEHRYATLEIPTHVLQLTLFTNLIETSLLYILSTNVIWTHTITPVWGALSRTVGTEHRYVT